MPIGFCRMDVPVCADYRRLFSVPGFSFIGFSPCRGNYPAPYSQNNPKPLVAQCISVDFLRSIPTEKSAEIEAGPAPGQASTYYLRPAAKDTPRAGSSPSTPTGVVMVERGDFEVRQRRQMIDNCQRWHSLAYGLLFVGILLAGGSASLSEERAQPTAHRRMAVS